MKHEYYIHDTFGNSVVYRFTQNNRTDGFYIDKIKNKWCGGNTERICLQNWHRIPRDQARKLFPKGFRKN